MHQPKPTLAERIDMDAGHASIYWGALCGRVYGYITGGSMPQVRPGEIETPIDFMHASYRFLF